MNYAHIKNNIVVNIVIADAEWVNAHDDDFVLIENQNVQIGSSYENGFFIRPQPYPSWTRDGNGWKAPVSLPNDSYNYETGLGVIYMWNEGTLSWVPLPDAG